MNKDTVATKAIQNVILRTKTIIGARIKPAIIPA